MNLENVGVILDQLDLLLRNQDGRGLLPGQRAVLHGLLMQSNPTRYEQLAIELKELGLGNYQPKTLKNDASKAFQRLTNAFGTGVRIRKNNFYREFRNWYEKQGISSNTAQPSANSAALDTQTPGNLLPMDCWQDGLDKLEGLVREGRRILCITGPPRIGKTYFTYALCDRLQSTFDAQVRCTASQVPTPEILYQTLMRELGNAAPQRSAIPALIELFRSRRLLLVIDGTEELYQPQQLAGHFRETASGYETWLRQLLEDPVYQSCLLWVGREPPVCFEYSRGVLALHRMSKLHDQDVLALLNARNTPLESADDRDRLLDFCGGNPDWLLMAVARIEQLHQGNGTEFLRNPSLAEEVMETLRHTLEHLSSSERLLLIGFLLHPVSPDQSLHSRIR